LKPSPDTRQAHFGSLRGVDEGVPGVRFPRAFRYYQRLAFYRKKRKGPGLKAPQIRNLFRGLKPPAPSGIFDLHIAPESSIHNFTSDPEINNCG
jgi:hypothetical protein